MTELDSLRNEFDKIRVSMKTSDGVFIIHALSNLTEEYDVMVLDRMEHRLMLKENKSNKLSIEGVRDKLSERTRELQTTLIAPLLKKPLW